MNNQSTESRGLSYWRLIEALTPQGLPKIQRERLPITGPWDAATPAPWAPSSIQRQKLAASRAPGRFQYTVYAGLYPTANLLEALERFFPADKAVFQDRSNAKSAICKFTVDDSGAPVVGTFVLSSAVWSVGLLLSKGDPSIINDAEWVNRFEAAHEKYSNSFDEWAGVWVASRTDDTDKSAPQSATHGALTRRDLDAKIGQFIEDLKCHPILSIKAGELEFEYLVTTANEPNASSDAVPDDNFMNSFFLTDIERVRKAWLFGDVGPALRTYLAGDPSVEGLRKDVRDPEMLPHLLELLSPDNFPIGAWPGMGKHPLVFSQQLAVNTISQTLFDGAGLFAINGPPGTGKTTLLRDVVALVVVERALLIAKGIPFFAGSPVRAWESARWTYEIAPVDRHFHGFEIVVASSNNGAVENVTLEIPGCDAIDPSWLTESDNPNYFSQLASDILSKSKPGAVDDSSSEKRIKIWAMLAAPLGNSTNRAKFKRQFWTRRAPESDVGKRSSKPDEASLPLRLTLEGQEEFPDFKTSLDRFRDACSKEQQIRATVRDAYGASKSIPIAEAEVSAAAEAVAEAQREAQEVVERSHPRVLELQAGLDAANEALAQAKTICDSSTSSYEKGLRRATRSSAACSARRSRLQAHTRTRPHWALVLVSLGVAGVSWWRTRRDLAARELRTRIRSEADIGYAQVLEQKANRAAAALTDCEGRNAAARKALERFADSIWQRLQRAESRHSKAKIELSTRRDMLASFVARYPDSYPDPVVLMQDEATREKCSLWLTAEWYEARCRVFLRALELHKAYIGANRDNFKRNLSAAVDVLSGTAPRDESARSAVLDAWRALFFVVPVLSTTFASLDRLFSQLGNQDIGWMMIDEAGQAAPQAAVGAIWRSRRALIVGDPLQLEPIVLIPYPLQKAAQRYPAFNIGDEWVPGKTSVQCQANSRMRLGTKLPRSGLWVGAPLRVHRRCDDPMFRISNSIAYDGTMVYGKPHQELGFAVGGISTMWIDVPFPRRGTSHCNEAEIVEVERVLGDLKRSGRVDLASNVILLAPFRDTANRLKNLRTKYGLSEKLIGTVHTAQGKEADIVILALGGSTAQARQWAASKPNLLNVAVTRAKKILVVVGSRENWSGLQHFETAAREIDKRSSQGVSTQISFNTAH